MKLVNMFDITHGDTMYFQKQGHSFAPGGVIAPGGIVGYCYYITLVHNHFVSSRHLSKI